MPTIGTPELVWKIIALLSLPWTAFFLIPCKPDAWLVRLASGGMVL